MTKQVQRRRGTAAQHTSFTGAEGEISVNTTNKSVHVHDGVTAGGVEAARADLDNVSSASVLSAAGITATATEINYTDGVTSAIQTQLDGKAPINNTTFTGTTVIPTADINGGTIDGVTIGASSAPTVTNIDINGGTIDGTVIGGSTPAAISGTTITGTSFATTGDMTFGDNDKAIFGAGSDLQIYHDGAASFIDEVGTGPLKIRTESFVGIYNGDESETIATFADDGAVRLYYDNAEKLATTATGIDVTGTVTADGLTVQSGIADIRAGNIGPSANASVNIGRDDTSISGGNPLGYVQFLGSDNTAGSLTPHAYIGAIASGTHTAGSNPTELVFGTTAGASETILDRLKIAGNGDISFYEDTGTTPKFFWNASAERLGIGTASPAQALHVVGNIRAEGAQPRYDWLETDTTDENFAIRINSGSLIFEKRSDDFLTQTERMRIDASGRLLIGGTTAYDNATLSVTSPSQTFTLITDGGTTGARSRGGFYHPSANVFALNTDGASGVLAFTQNGTERARVDPSGNLLVGMTGTTSSVTYGGVYIRGDNSSGGVNDYAQVFVQYNSVFNHGIVLKELGAGGNAVRFMNNAGTIIGSITTTASSTAYNTSSDYRLKEDVQPMLGASDRVLALKPVNFAWKVDGSRVDGFIAHEAQEVVPECVTGEKDAVQIVEIKDEDGNVTGTEERPVYQGIDQSKLTPLLTAALQEALKRIEALEAEVAALKGEPA